MKVTSAIIIGAGQTGLAMSHALSTRRIPHFVLERGSVGEAWRSQRWDSLCMLTPNWANGLPEAPYSGPDPHGFMTSGEFAGQLEKYVRDFALPVKENINVNRVWHDSTHFRVDTSDGPIAAESVILATGAASRPNVPSFADDVPEWIFQITPDRYKNPRDLPDGGVLVVGGSASGVQMARELRNAGRPIILSTGNHVRLPRRYRNRDIETWLDVTGVLDQLTTEIGDVERAKRLPSPQLQGGIDDVDLNALQSMGVSIVGRFSAIRDGEALFSGGLSHVANSADLKMNRLFDLADAWIEEHGVADEIAAADRPGATVLPANPRLSIPFDSGEIRSIVWATGFRPDFSYVDLPVFDRRGDLIHSGGVCTVPGLFVMGLPFLRRRRSHHISGVEKDAQELGDLITKHLRLWRAA